MKSSFCVLSVKGRGVLQQSRNSVKLFRWDAATEGPWKEGGVRRQSRGRRASSQGWVERLCVPKQPAMKIQGNFPELGDVV